MNPVKLANGRYRIRARVNGRYLNRTFDRKGDATAWAAQARTDARLRRSGPELADARITVAEWAQRWRDASAVRRSTRAKIDSHLDVQIIPAFGDVRLVDLTRLDVQAWVGRLQGTLAEATVRSVYGTLSKMLTDAVEEPDVPLEVSPCRRVKILPSAPTERVALSEEQLAGLIHAVPEQWRALVHTLAWTGARWSEVTGLRSRDFDPLKGLLTIVGTSSEVRGRVEREAPKTERSERVIDLDPLTVQVLAAQVAGPMLFTAPEGGVIYRGSFRQRVWLPAVASLGLDPAPRVRDLRHTHATILLNRGVPIVEVSRRLGHSRTSTTLDIYGQRSSASRENILTAIMSAQVDPPKGKVVNLRGPLLVHDDANTADLGTDATVGRAASERG